jgi:formylglycine-generating enzyme required for sulfatase activity
MFEQQRALLNALPPFIFYPTTTFQMGMPERALSELAKRYGGTRESYREESPQHRLVLPPYALAAVPVTNQLYAALVATGSSRPPIVWHGTLPPPELAMHPVTDISWHEAQHFCNWLNEQIGTQLASYVNGTLGKSRFRLPSEAEWEQAARGDDRRSFPWGDDFDVLYANTREAGHGGTSPVGAYPQGASPSGVLDMAGNVWEWTASLDRRYPYDAQDGREDNAAQGRRILRGGCYANPHGFARCACRFRLPPTMHNEFTGFRLALNL